MTTGQHLRPAVGRVSYEGVGFLHCIIVDKRADLDSLLSPPADLERLYSFGDPGGKLVGNSFVHDEPVRRCAGLTDVAELSDHGTFDSGTKISIIEDQEGRVAAQLHGRTQNVAGRLL